MLLNVGRKKLRLLQGMCLFFYPSFCHPQRAAKNVRSFFHRDQEIVAQAGLQRAKNLNEINIKGDANHFIMGTKILIAPKIQHRFRINLKIV